MKKPILICLLALMAFSAKSQKLIEYKASNGLTYHIGDTVRMGRGSSPVGNFKYLEMGGWGKYAFAESGKGESQFNADKSFTNSGAFIKKIDQEKKHGITTVVFVVAIGASTHYNLYIEDAIATCEVTPCSTNNANVQQSDDNLDKLKKLKSLLDSGAITQVEYDEQKKKLLNQ